MTGKYIGIVWKLEQFFRYASYKLVVASSRQVGTPDTALEKHISCNDKPVCPIVEHYASGAMSRHMNHFKTTGTYTDHVPFLKPVLNFSRMHFFTDAKLSGLIHNALEQRLVKRMRLYPDSISVSDEAIAYGMVDMQMGIYEMRHFKMFALDKIAHGILLLDTHHTRVYDGRLAAFRVKHHVCVDSKERKLESGYFQHIILHLNVAAPYLGIAV